jgi:DNA-binding response OmpR family regulator
MARKLIVVEDDPRERRVLEIGLRKQGFEVTAVSDGLKALSQVEAGHPDLIVTNLVLPNLDGMRLLKALKGNSETRHIPVIMLTAKADPSAMVEGIRSGARFYVVKPYDLKDLTDKINRALE